MQFLKKKELKLEFYAWCCMTYALNNGYIIIITYIIT